MPNLWHFYHLWLGPGWKSIFEEHLGYLEESGLSLQLDQLRIGLVGSAAERAACKKYLAEHRLRFCVVAEAETGFEQVTLNAAYEFARANHEGYVLYAHNKGCLNDTPINREWRKSMSYYLVTKWREAIAHLGRVDAVGCHWLTNAKYPKLVETPFFGGNFWWTHCRVLRELGYPRTTSRWDAECWLGQKADIRTHDLNPGWPSLNLFKIR